jgi:hypothetical protein
MPNNTTEFKHNYFDKHENFIDLANNLSNEEKCLLITTLTNSMKKEVDVLLVGKDEKVKASFSCNSTWLTASMRGLAPVFAFELDYIDYINQKGKQSFDKDVQKFITKQGE